MKVDDFPGFFLWPFHGAQWLHWCNGSPHPRCPRRAVVPSSQIWWPWSPAVSTVVSTKFIANFPENGKPRSSLSHVMYSLPISPKGALRLWAPWRWYSTLAQWVYWDHWNQRLKCYQPFTMVMVKTPGTRNVGHPVSENTGLKIPTMDLAGKTHGKSQVNQMARVQNPSTLLFSPK